MAGTPRRIYGYGHRHEVMRNGQRYFTPYVPCTNQRPYYPVPQYSFYGNPPAGYARVSNWPQISYAYSGRHYFMNANTPAYSPAAPSTSSGPAPVPECSNYGSNVVTIVTNDRSVIRPKNTRTRQELQERAERMEYSTVSYPTDGTGNSDKRHGLTIPFMMFDFKCVIRTGKETRFQKRIVSLGENPTIKYSIDVDFTGETLSAWVQYFTEELPRRSFEVSCSIKETREPASDQTIYREFHHENLWLTSVGGWRKLCSFPAILTKKELYDYVEKDFRFILIFQFIEGECVDVQPTLKTLTSIFENETFADFTIVSQGKEFKVHRGILATASAVFEAMFLSPMREQQENKMTINNIEPTIVKEMLRFIYTGSVQNLKEHAEKLLIAADEFSLNSLKVHCSRFLTATIDTENVLKMLAFADTYHDDRLRQSALNFINGNLKATIQNKDNVEILTSRPDFALEILLNIA